MQLDTLMIFQFAYQQVFCISWFVAGRRTGFGLERIREQFSSRIPPPMAPPYSVTGSFRQLKGPLNLKFGKIRFSGTKTFHDHLSGNGGSKRIFLHSGWLAFISLFKIKPRILSSLVFAQTTKTSAIGELKSIFSSC